MTFGFSFEKLGYSHPNGKLALQNIDLSAKAGEQIAIIGPSGAGKTTFLNILATGTRPLVGHIQILDTKPWDLSSAELKHLRSKIGLIHQAPPLPPKQRVITAVLAGKLGQWSTLKAILSLLYPVDIQGAYNSLVQLDLGEKLFERCDQLSGGQLQRVGIARVLYQEPALMLADEPVSAMDPVLSDLTIKRLTQYASERNITFVASLHDINIALKWFPRMIGLRDGQIMFDLPTPEVTSGLLEELYESEMDSAMQKTPTELADTAKYWESMTSLQNSTGL
jgi:phosphonate transport system ATP-binding protein